MTAYRHLPASAASVLLGTALLLACAPKAQAAEDTKQDIATQAQAELVQKQGTEPEKPVVGDAAEHTQTEEKPALPDDASTKENGSSSETSEAPVKNTDQPAETEALEQVTKNELARTTVPAPKPQTRDNEETVDKAKVDAALDQLFKQFKFLKMDIDTAKGVLPDPSLIFANFDSQTAPNMHITWEDENSVKELTQNLGDHSVNVVVTFDTDNPDFPYKYELPLTTMLHVYEKESDYAMIYGDPNDKVRNYFVFYDVDLQKPIAKRVFYGHEGDRSLDDTYDAMHQGSEEFRIFGYETGSNSGPAPDYSDTLNDIAQTAGLNDQEKDLADKVRDMAQHFAVGNYDNDTTMSINDFSRGSRNMVYFLTAVDSRKEPVPYFESWGSNNYYDFSNNQVPDPRYFIRNWGMLPEGSKAEWIEKPIVDRDGWKNRDTTRIAVTVNGGVPIILHLRGNANFGNVFPDDVGEETSLEDYYKHPSHAILRSDIPTVEVGTLPAAKDFIKYHQQSASLDDAVWVIKPDITKAGFTHGLIKFPGSYYLLVFLDVVPKKTPDPKPDPDPEPKPDPKPDPEPEPQPDPEPDPIPVPAPDPLPDIPEDPDKDEDDDKPEEKKPEEKKQTKQTTKKVVTKTQVKVTQPTVQQKRAALPQTGNKGLLALALGAAVSIIGLGLLRKKRY